ncbi:MAG: enoyl-CoA hydratase [Acidobacteria bacterium]|nr:enoyl-CoA hydratase [Acidobacteriota bacterium]
MELFENLSIERRDQVALVTINRPKVLNALNALTIDELARCFTTLKTDADVSVVILTGAGERAFVAGADIRELAQYTPEQAKACALKGQALCDKIEKLGKPTIAAINGLALGGGCEIALACTLRIASQTARLGQPEVKLGIIPGYGGTQRLPRLVGRGRALELILTGEQLSAEDALRWGLVNRVVPPDQLIAAALELAARIVANSPRAVSLAMEAVNEGLDSPLAQGLFLEASLFGLSFSTSDMQEGTKSFLEKRPANFAKP